MNIVEVFNENVSEYERWFDRYPFVFQSEIEAVREMLPEGDSLSGIEVGLGTGRYSHALQIKEGVEPSARMRAEAIKRGIDTVDAMAEKLPYGDLRFDFVLMVFAICYFKDIGAAFREACRVLKQHGRLVVGFIDKDSTIGKLYEARRHQSVFYKHANFYSVDKVLSELGDAGFRHFDVCQTLFGDIDAIHSIQFPEKGHGMGSFVVISAYKKRYRQE